MSHRITDSLAVRVLGAGPDQSWQCSTKLIPVVIRGRAEGCPSAAVRALLAKLDAPREARYRATDALRPALRDTFRVGSATEGDAMPILTVEVLGI